MDSAPQGGTQAQGPPQPPDHLIRTVSLRYLLHVDALSQPTQAPLPQESPPQAVRFASVNQEIEPAHSLQSDTQASDNSILDQQLSPQQREEIRTLTNSLHQSHLQQRRMSNYAFEPVSLPVSRSQSDDSSPYPSLREPTRSGAPSPKRSPPSSAMPTPPPTPYGTHAGEGQVKDGAGAGLAKVHPDPVKMAPQVAGPDLVPEPQADGLPPSTATSRFPSHSDQVSTRPTSISGGSNGPDAQQKKGADFLLGPSASSSSPSLSRETSPSHTSGEGGSGAVTPPTTYPRPFTPSGDRDDPYARSKRAPQSRNLDSIDARFVFGGGDSRRRSGIGLGSQQAASTGHLPRSSSGKDLKNEHRQSTFSLHSLAGSKDGHKEEKHGSMSDLKRFFGFSHKTKRGQSPAASAKASANSSGTKTPPHQAPAANVPFADDHGLQTKYGKFGKILGSGAGGSVRLMKRQSDGVTFAVKQFRDRHGYESERDYNKKVTAEFCIGSTLHHGNIIETLDIIHEKGHWFEVMEYAPYDLFAIVMTGKMSREEIACCFFQIVAGVAFLHGMGLAHRDLKLDNVVVNEHGIMKIIDFGSASVFKYPFENDVILATGKFRSTSERECNLQSTQASLGPTLTSPQRSTMSANTIHRQPMFGPWP